MAAALVRATARTADSPLKTRKCPALHRRFGAIGIRPSCGRFALQQRSRVRTVLNLRFPTTRSARMSTPPIGGGESLNPVFSHPDTGEHPSAATSSLSQPPRAPSPQQFAGLRRPRAERPQQPSSETPGAAASAANIRFIMKELAYLQMMDGTSATDAAATHGISDKQDIAWLAASEGAAQAMGRAMKAMHAGATADEVIAQFGVKRERDIDLLRAGFGGRTRSATKRQGQ